MSLRRGSGNINNVYNVSDCARAELSWPPANISHSKANFIKKRAARFRQLLIVIPANQVSIIIAKRDKICFAPT